MPRWMRNWAAFSCGRSLGEIDDDGLADAVDAVDAAAGESFDDLVGRGLEGLGLVAGPDGADRLAVDALVDAVGYGFDFGEFGHAFPSIGARLERSSPMTPIAIDRGILVDL